MGCCLSSQEDCDADAALPNIPFFTNPAKIEAHTQLIAPVDEALESATKLAAELRAKAA